MNCPACGTLLRTAAYLQYDEDHPQGVATVGYSCSTPDCPENMVQKYEERIKDHANQSHNQPEEHGRTGQGS